MKKILVKIFCLVSVACYSQTQLKPKQIRIDTVTVIGNANEELSCDTALGLEHIATQAFVRNHSSSFSADSCFAHLKTDSLLGCSPIVIDATNILFDGGNISPELNIGRNAILNANGFGIYSSYNSGIGESGNNNIIIEVIKNVARDGYSNAKFNIDIPHSALVLQTRDSATKAITVSGINNSPVTSNITITRTDSSSVTTKFVDLEPDVAHDNYLLNTSTVLLATDTLLNIKNHSVSEFSVLGNGMITVPTSMQLQSGVGGYQLWNSGHTFNGRFLFSSLTANRNYTWPNASGTVALTSNIPPAQTLTFKQIAFGSAANLVTSSPLLRYDTIHQSFTVSFGTVPNFVFNMAGYANGDGSNARVMQLTSNSIGFTINNDSVSGSAGMIAGSVNIFADSVSGKAEILSDSLQMPIGNGINTGFVLTNIDGNGEAIWAPPSIIGNPTSIGFFDPFSGLLTGNGDFKRDTANGEGIYNNIDITRSLGYATGIVSQITSEAGTTNNEFYGEESNLNINGDIGNTQSAGLHIKTFFNSGSHTGVYTGFDLAPIGTQATGNIDYFEGTSIDGQSINDSIGYWYAHYVGGASPGTGTITHQYGVYLENINMGTIDDYSIYTNAGKVRFGDTLIQSMNGVTGAIYSSSDTTYFESTKPIKINNGSTSVSDFEIQNKSIVKYQYTTPATTDTIISDGRSLLVVNPVGSLLVLSIKFPSSPIQGQILNVVFTQIISSLTLLNGTILGGITSAAANSSVKYQYVSEISKWVKN